MSSEIRRDGVYVPGEVVSREIEGELIIVPLVSGMGDLEDELYTFNEFGRAIWEKLDGAHTVDDIIRELLAEYEASEERLTDDVLGLLDELARRQIIVAG